MSTRLRNIGLITFLLSGLCATSSGVVVSLLQQHYGFSFGMTGTLLSIMSIGNMVAAFLTGVLPGKIGMKNSLLLMSAGFTLGYFLMGVSGAAPLLFTAFALLGIAKGSTLNACNVLVGQNSKVPARGLSLLHACFATGALLGPVIISLLSPLRTEAPLWGISALGALMWLIYLLGGLPGKSAANDGKPNKAEKRDLSFFRSPEFWILTGLLFCQNGTEQSVNGWLVTYYRDSQILSGTLANYTVTILWTATLIGRLLTAFVFPVKNIFRTVSIMSFGCVVMYAVLVQMNTPGSAILALSAFAFCMSSINPIAVSGVGKQMNAATLGVLLPLGSIGAILVPWLIGVVADSFGLKAGMAIVLVPCIGMFLLSFLMMKRTKPNN